MGINIDHTVVINNFVCKNVAGNNNDNDFIRREGLIGERVNILESCRKSPQNI